ncbi:MAG: xanthine dehydrogenase family protein subunit M [Candidatus Bathyarchaeia archaeon]
MWYRFEYIRPRTLDEASKIHSEEPESVFFAGGTDLLIQMKKGNLKLKYVIDLKGIGGLDRVTFKDKRLHIGSLTTLRAIETSSIIKEKFNLLSIAAGQMGSVQIRNRGTIGGNICNASPGADLPPPLIALGANVKVLSPKGEKILQLKDFFKGPGETVLERGQILTEIIIPETKGKGAFIKYTIRPMEVSIMNLAVWADLTEDMRCMDIRVAVGAAGPTPMRLKAVEEYLKDRRLTEDNIREAAKYASGEIRPSVRERARVSPDYRRHLVRILTIQALRTIMG